MTLPDVPTLRPRSDIGTIDVGSLSMWRVWHPGPHTHAGNDMRTYGPLLRYDPHPTGPPTDHPDVPVWYGAEMWQIALMEVYGRNAAVEVIDICPIAARASYVTVKAGTNVVDLDADTPPRGLPTATPALGTSLGSYVKPQAWARALHGVQGVHGVLYRAARTDHLDMPHTAVAVWRRNSIGASRRDVLLSDPLLRPRVEATLDTIDVGVQWQRCSNCAAN